MSNSLVDCRIYSLHGRSTEAFRTLSINKKMKYLLLKSKTCPGLLSSRSYRREGISLVLFRDRHGYSLTTINKLKRV